SVKWNSDGLPAVTLTTVALRCAAAGSAHTSNAVATRPRVRTLIFFIWIGAPFGTSGTVAPRYQALRKNSRVSDRRRALRPRDHVRLDQLCRDRHRDLLR